MNQPLIKTGNALSAGFSYFKSTLTKKSVVYGLPPAVGAELTNHCNLSCPECNSGSGLMTRSRGFMSIVLFEKIIEELGSAIFNMNLYFQGEPMMHPRFFGILEKCADINTTLSTNGHYLSPENAEKIVRSQLSRLIISLDGMDDMTYSSYRVNGDFETVIRGIRSISEAKKRIPSPLKLVIQFLVNRNNEHQIPEVRKFATEMNASLSLKSMQIISRDSCDSWLPVSGKFSRYLKTPDGYKIKNRLPNHCARLWFNPVITWDGKVLPCCFDKNADHIMGDFNKDHFKDIWNGPEYRQFRNSVLTGRKNIKICNNCTSNLRY